MRLWAEERKSGTIELLMTMPLSTSAAVVGKFFAAWVFVAVALALTFPLWVTVNVLGEPDNGVIAAGYVGSLLMAGAFLAIGSCMSALTRNQVVAFILAAAICFLFTMAGVELVRNTVLAVFPPAVADGEFLQFPFPLRHHFERRNRWTRRRLLPIDDPFLAVRHGCRPRRRAGGLRAECANARSAP